MLLRDGDGAAARRRVRREGRGARGEPRRPRPGGWVASVGLDGASVVAGGVAVEAGAFEGDVALVALQDRAAGARGRVRREVRRREGAVALEEVDGAPLAGGGVAAEGRAFDAERRRVGVRADAERAPVGPQVAILGEDGPGDSQVRPGDVERAALATRGGVPREGARADARRRRVARVRAARDDGRPRCSAGSAATRSPSRPASSRGCGPSRRPARRRRRRRRRRGRGGRW